jgi:hypothetical protein
MFFHDVLACASMMRLRSGNIGRLNMGGSLLPRLCLVRRGIRPIRDENDGKGGVRTVTYIPLKLSPSTCFFDALSDAQSGNLFIIH